MITRTFKLCLNAGTGSAPFINVSQTDKDEVWLFELYTETGERYIPSSGAIIGIKSDGHGIANTGTVDSEGRVVITETEQMTASAGRAIFELSIDGLTHGTANFIVNVEKKPIDGAIMSDSDLSLISQAVDAAATIEDLIEGHDPDEVITDAVDAWLDNHPEATTTVEDGAITSAKLNDSVKTGLFEDMTVGTSLAVMNDEGQTDNLAYKIRPTGGDAVRELDEIVGGTIAWNQLVQELNSTNWATESGVTATYADGAATISSTTAGNGIYQRTNVSVFSGHKYLTMLDVKGTSGLNCRATVATTGVVYDFPVTDNWATYCAITLNNLATANRFYVFGKSSTYENLQVRNVMLFDLTQMFGSTIADAIYAMEQSSAGSGVAYFRSLFPNSYYAYNSGELVSVDGLSSHDTTESNILGGHDLGQAIVDAVANTSYSNYGSDENGDYVTVRAGSPMDGISFTRSGLFKENTQYTIILKLTRNAVGTSLNSNLKIRYTDGSNTNIYFAETSTTEIITKVSVTAEGKTVKEIVTTYGGGTTKLYYDGCGIFEGVLTQADFKPYTKHSYALDSSLTLRGVPKWSNGLYFDGDIYRHDGSVSRRYGVVDLGTLNWTYYNESNRLIAYPPSAKVVSSGISIICSKYIAIDASVARSNMPDKTIKQNTGLTGVYVYDSAYTDAATFKSAMSGVYLVYELATPTAETADPYQQYQICDGKGTEEYISETVTPVGHNTFYPVDIVSKVNKLPSDFSTLIAPTEEGFKATRNYTAKQFLIINNQLYRVTANIANGANIVPNTNVTAVTIADILTTLI